jgi:hypothetical protein
MHDFQVSLPNAHLADVHERKRQRAQPRVQRRSAARPRLLAHDSCVGL